MTCHFHFVHILYNNIKIVISFPSISHRSKNKNKNSGTAKSGSGLGNRINDN